MAMIPGPEHTNGIPGTVPSLHILGPTDKKAVIGEESLMMPGRFNSSLLLLVVSSPFTDRKEDKGKYSIQIQSLNEN